MKQLATMVMALMAMAMNVCAQSDNEQLTYASDDGQCTLKCTGKVITMHFARDLFMSVMTDGKSDLTPVVYNGEVKSDQRVCIWLWWKDGKENRDLYLKPRTYRDGYCTRGVFGHKFHDYVSSAPASITLMVPYEDELAEVTLWPSNQ